ncbi:ABC transporter substrate-binding protein [Tardisphaera saccharovorans]
MGGFIAPVSAANTAQIYTTVNAMMIYTPSMPVWNMYAANNFITANAMTSDMPMAMYSPTTNAIMPVLASKYEEFPSNGTLIVYLRKGLSWYNGSATLPFNAWDVYTEFYIGVKVFSWYFPFVNYTGIHVLNNYTIEFLIKPWAPSIPLYILSQRIATPYSVWKPVLENVTAMNKTEAVLHEDAIERFVAPPWFLGPYYTTISVPYGIMHLDPPNLVSEWAPIFPYHTWQDYNPEIIIWWSGGNGQTMNGALEGLVDWSQTGFSPAQFKILSSIGFDNLFYFQFGGHWIYLFNPSVYPFNITQVREALAYAQNYTEAVDAWDAYGIQAWGAAHRETWPTCQYPQWLDKITPRVYYDPAKAASLLESVGFYKQNGQWYMPNGQPFKITMDIPGGWTDVDTIGSNVASQFTAFGIPTEVIAMDPGTLYSDVLPSGDWSFMEI